MAAVIEVARVFKAGPPPARTILFTVWTGEERGLLGSEYYAQNPGYPLAKMAANFTFDTLSPLGPSRDVVLIGSGQNQLEDLLRAAAARHRRTVTPDPKPERALNFRADHFSFGRRGVPTLLLMALAGGQDLVNGGREAGNRWIDDFTARCYHQPCDTWAATQDFSGAAADVALTVELKPIRARTASERR